MKRTRPNPVEVELTIQRPNAGLRSGNVTDKQQETAGQATVLVTAQNLLSGKQTSIFVSVKKHCNKQRLFDTPGQIE
jgi:hypothetical protein